MGILQRIAICYFISGVAFLLCPPLPIEKDEYDFPRLKDVVLHVPVKYSPLWLVGIIFAGAYAAITFGLYVPDYRIGSTWSAFIFCCCFLGAFLLSSLLTFSF